MYGRMRYIFFYRFSRMFKTSLENVSRPFLYRHGPLASDNVQYLNFEEEKKKTRKTFCRFSLQTKIIDKTRVFNLITIV